MIIRNLMEDVVSAVVNDVLADTDAHLTRSGQSIGDLKQYIPDIMAYVLNRIPPRYITSERGILHGRIESRFYFQQKTDILFFVHEAIEVIRERRAAGQLAPDKIAAGAKNLYFPHIMGEVLESETFSIVPDIKVTLLHNGKPARMIDEYWQNPFITNRSTNGYFHFWPEVDEAEMSLNQEVNFTLSLSHPKMEAQTVDVKLKVMNNFNLQQSLTIPLVLLKVSGGIDSEFIYE